LGVFWAKKPDPLFAKYALVPAVLPQNSPLPLTADETGGFNPEITVG